jgi:hypothetical protein
LQGSLTYRKIIRHGANGFTSSPKEGVLRNVITLKNPSPSARFEQANFGSMWCKPVTLLILYLIRIINLHL